MRVVLDYRPALRARTGIGEYVHELARAIGCTAQPEDALTLFSSSWADRVAADAAADLPGAAIVDRRVPVAVLTWAWHHWEWPPVERWTAACDIAHSPTPLLLPAKAAAQVVTVFDLFFLDRPADTRGPSRDHYPSRVRDHVRRADHVIAGSDHAAALVRDRLGVRADRITATPLGAPRWAPAVRRARGDALGTTLLFIGTLERRKNLGVLLEAYESLLATRADVPPLVVAGRSTPETEEWIARMDAPPLAGRVRRLGYVSDAERHALYRDARALVLPSLDEGFGLPVLEAMACGVPVVASAVGALPEVVGNAGLLVPPNDPAAWAVALTRCLDDATSRDLSSRGLARAGAFTWERTATLTRQAYAAAVATRAGRA